MVARAEFLFVDAIDLADPTVVGATQVLAQEGVVKVVPIGAGQQKPTQPIVVVVKKDHLQQAHIFDALATVLKRSPNVILRDDAERPSISVDHSRSRGFEPAEIERELQPWVEEARVAVEAKLAEAKKAYDAAVIEAAATYENARQNRERIASEEKAYAAASVDALKANESAA
jgi:hypothetical protein